MTVKTNDIMVLIEMFEASDWREMRIGMDGLHLLLSKDAHAQFATIQQSQATPAAMPLQTAATSLPMNAPVSDPLSAAPVVSDIPVHWTAVTAPNLGTFYRASKPGQPPLVEIGQMVDAHTEICLLEVMKLFTSVKAGISGTVRQVCVVDAEMVEHGQPLFYIEQG
jgi:acetyl-CoA carboxylase biotin carboxyl carrier protein